MEINKRDIPHMTNEEYCEKIMDILNKEDENYIFRWFYILILRTL